MISVIIPAYNEGQVIGRLLRRLVASEHSAELDIIVVANGCTDDTAEVAAGFGPPVRVLDISAASKPAALAAGDQAASGFPRVYLDADVEIGADDLRALEAALQRPGVLAAGPEREFDMKGRPWAIRWYYDVWTRLPEVQRGLFGRGVIAVGEKGRDRIAGLAPVIADDLAVSLAFKPQERAIAAQARVLIHPPRTVRDLLRRRVRVAEGLSQLGKTAGMPEPDASRTRLDDLLSVAKANPKMMPKVGLFLLVATVGRLRARRSVSRNDYSVWHRDESSRQ
jgi:glycosyltransferase involved in cell wall biosynthesis